MPIYEYRCERCRRTTTVITQRVGVAVTPRCDRCDSPDVVRVLSAPARVRSATARFDAVSDPTGIDESDPRAVAGWLRTLGDELAPDAGDDFAEVVDDIEAGADDEGDET